MVVFLVHLGLLVRAVTNATNGSFCYPLDDAFIHLSLARNIAFHGTFGMTPGVFASASSSVLWPLLLAFFIRIIGDHAILPLLINAALGATVPWLVNRTLHRAEAHWLLRLLTPALVVFVTPLTTIAALGMEHSLHIVLGLLFLDEAVRFLREGRRFAPLAALAFLLTATRYEAIFPVCATILLLLRKRRIKEASVLGSAAVAPVVLFGIYSILHGARFLPNSVLLKGRPIALKGVGDVFNLVAGDLVDRLALNSHLLVIFGGLALVWWLHHEQDGELSQEESDRARILLFTLAAHIVFAGLGWFYRYEAYLIVTGVVTVASSIHRPQIQRRNVALIAALGLSFLSPLFRRAVQAIGATPAACRNIYQQQWQMGRFLHEHFEDDAVAVNDIGAVAYQRKGPLVDLVGLASFSVAKAKKFKIDTPLSPEDLLHETAAVPVAIVYEQWIGESIPSSWVRLGRWRIDNLKSPAYADVAIYACNEQAIPRVLAALRTFGKTLPKGVHQEGRYLEPLGAPAVGDAYELHANDTLVVRVASPSGEKLKIAPVFADGTVFVPGGKPIDARGRTVAAIEKELLAQPETNVREARLAEARPYRISVFGAVARPAELEWPSPPTARAAAQAAGAMAPERLVRLREAQGQIERTELFGTDLDQALLPGDFVLVPERRK